MSEAKDGEADDFFSIFHFLTFLFQQLQPDSNVKCQREINNFISFWKINKIRSRGV